MPKYVAQTGYNTDNTYDGDKTNLAVEVERTRAARVWSVLETLDDGDSLLDALRSVFCVSWLLVTGDESLGLR